MQTLSMGKYIKALLLGLCVGILICALLLTGISFALASAKILPTSVLTTITLVICALSSFCGAYVTVRKTRNKGLLLGLACGILMFLIIFIVGLSNSTETGGVVSVIKLVAMASAGGVGGVMSVNKKQKVK